MNEKERLVECIRRLREVAILRLRKDDDRALEVQKTTGHPALSGYYDVALEFICQGRSDEWIADMLIKTATPDYVP